MLRRDARTSPEARTSTSLARRFCSRADAARTETCPESDRESSSAFALLNATTLTLGERIAREQHAVPRMWDGRRSLGKLPLFRWQDAEAAKIVAGGFEPDELFALAHSIGKKKVFNQCVLQACIESGNFSCFRCVVDNADFSDAFLGSVMTTCAVAGKFEFAKFLVDYHGMTWNERYYTWAAHGGHGPFLWQLADEGVEMTETTWQFVDEVILCRLNNFSRNIVDRVRRRLRAMVVVPEPIYADHLYAKRRASMERVDCDIEALYEIDSVGNSLSSDPVTSYDLRYADEQLRESSDDVSKEDRHRGSRRRAGDDP